jgi:hypothetical protein
LQQSQTKGSRRGAGLAEKSRSIAFLCVRFFFSAIWRSILSAGESFIICGAATLRKRAGALPSGRSRRSRNGQETAPSGIAVSHEPPSALVEARAQLADPGRRNPKHANVARCFAGGRRPAIGRRSERAELWHATFDFGVLDILHEDVTGRHAKSATSRAWCTRRQPSI